MIWCARADARRSQEVIAAARPLADMLWARETEGHSFDTPERRAALEARINEVTGADRRRSGAQILPPGFQRAAVRSSSRRRRANVASGRSEWREPRRGGNWRERRNNGDWQRRRRRAGGRSADALCGGEPAAGLEPGASRPPHGGAAARGADPAGRAQPSLAAARSSGGTGLARVPPCRCRAAQGRADRYRRPCLRRLDAEALRAELAGRDLAEAMERVAAVDHHPLGLGGPAGRPRRTMFLVTWQQLVALHRQWHSLTKELKDAEQALGPGRERSQLFAVARRQGPPVADGRNRGPD